MGKLLIRTSSGQTITQVLAGGSNVFLLTKGDKHLLVDTGPKSSRRALSARLRTLRITHLDYLVLTHSHYDHSDNASWVREQFGAQVVVQRNELSYLETGALAVIRGTNIFTNTMVKLLVKWLSPLVSPEPCKADIVIDETLGLSLWGFNAYILHTPGHSVGSMSVIVDDEVAIVGDAMFGVFKGSVFPPFAENVPEMVRSWGKLLATRCRLFLPSHGTSDTREMLQKEYDQRS